MDLSSLQEAKIIDLNWEKFLVVILECKSHTWNIMGSVSIMKRNIRSHKVIFFFSRKNLLATILIELSLQEPLTTSMNQLAFNV